MSLQGTTSLIVPLISARDTELADQGVVFTAMNPTLGTAIAGHAAATTYDSTKGLLYIFNNGTNVIYPLQLRLTLTNAGTAGTTVRFTQALDTGPTRYSSGGTSITPVNTNMASSTTSSAQIYFGAVTLAAATGSVRTVCDHVYRNVIGVVNDTYTFSWGGPVAGPLAAVTTLGTGVVNVGVNYPPLAIQPNKILVIHQWSPSQSGAYQFEFEFSYIEK